MSPLISTRVTAGLLLLALSGPLAAQSRLYVQESDNKFHVVLKVDDSRPYILENGKLVAAKGQRLALKEVEEYLPVFIGIQDKEARPDNPVLSYSETPTNNKFHYSAKFESADALDDVFVVLELEISNVGKKLYVYEVGHLEPRTPKAFSADMALGQYMGSGQVGIHLFVGGTEVFQSEQPAVYRAEKLDRMIAKRISAVRQANPRPFFGSAPGYPAALRKSGLKGEAVVTIRVSPEGTVLEAVVERASEPAFGEEALAAAKQWRFVPRVQDGRAVEAKVSIPFAFDPPKENAR